MFQQIVEEAIRKTGSTKALAYELDVDQSTISRFKHGEAGLKIEVLNKLVHLSNRELVENGERQKLIDSALLFAELYKGAKK